MEFEYDEIAKIAADTMNNYLVREKLLKCEYIYIYSFISFFPNLCDFQNLQLLFLQGLLLFPGIFYLPHPHDEDAPVKDPSYHSVKGRNVSMGIPFL